MTAPISLILGRTRGHRPHLQDGAILVSLFMTDFFLLYIVICRIRLMTVIIFEPTMLMGAYCSEIFRANKFINNVGDALKCPYIQADAEHKAVKEPLSDVERLPEDPTWSDFCEHCLVLAGRCVIPR